MLYLLITLLFTSCIAHDVSFASVVWTDLLPEPGLSLDKYPTYHNSMPIGNGHVASNVNYESADDTIIFLIDASSSWGQSPVLYDVYIFIFVDFKHSFVTYVLVYICMYV